MVMKMGGGGLLPVAHDKVGFEVEDRSAFRQLRRSADSACVVDDGDVCVWL